MPNRLSRETSPYLLQHANNPVDWYPWGDEALEKARAEDKPIFLSIGYAACHWCHVMAHESFEDPGIAAQLNEHFVCIKVDREERPDIDSIYMAAVVAMAGQGGWPMSVFLTPDGQPFYGGTYFPPVRRYGMPSFVDVLNGVVHTWKEGRESINSVAQRLSEHLKATARWSAEGEAQLNEQQLSQAASTLINTYDWPNGGWGQAPKFPQPMALEFLLAQSGRAKVNSMEVVRHCLELMSRGGMYDVVGGGFHRYSTDQFWRIPHFEKMLYDNAQLARVYLHAYQVSGNPAFRQVCEETLDFILRELSDPAGGFYSSLDADSEGGEGSYYLWSWNEVRAVLGDTPEFDFFKSVYGVTPGGNFENGNNVLQRGKSLDELAARRGMESSELTGRLKQCHQALFAARQSRPRPATDDKVLTAWNGLALCALAEAARELDRADYLEAAQRNAHFLLDSLYVGGRLLRAWRGGVAQHNGYLEDYAGLVLGLLALYQTDLDVRWYQAAHSLAGEMVADFRGEGGELFDVRTDQSGLIVRPRDMQDNATPCGNSLAAQVLLTLAALDERSDWRKMAEDALRQVMDAAVRYPTAFAGWLQAADFAIGPVDQAALVWPAGSSAPGEYIQILQKGYHPRQVLAGSADVLTVGSPKLLKGRSARQDLPTVYLCHDFRCDQPINSLEFLKLQRH